MLISILNCEDERIDLCGKIQNFGYLLVFDLSKKCIALSQNCIDWLFTDPKESMHRDMDYFLNTIGYHSEVHVSSLFHQPINFITVLNHQEYHVTIYLNEDLVFCEFEVKSRRANDIANLIDIQQQLDQSDDIWDALSQKIYCITDFDRIMIYQFQEDNSGIVVAEHVKENVESLLGYRYPDFDIPLQARRLYAKHLFRQTTDIYAESSPVIGLEGVEIDLSKSNIRALSPSHLKYLENFGVRASASFSIIINNRLWGLVACQHLTPKYLCPDIRNHCLFIVNYAASKHLVNEKEKALEYAYSTREIELELKEKLLYSQSLEYVLGDFADRLISLLKSDGMIIKTPDSILRFGEVPDDAVFMDLHDDINVQMSIDGVRIHNIFVTSSFKFVHKANSEVIFFPGVARINIGNDLNYGIYWFRKEIHIEEKWAGNPQKNMLYSDELNTYYYSPRVSFDAWVIEKEGNSDPWTDTEYDLIKRVQKIVFDSFLYKIEEMKRLNQKLIESNNKLDTFSHELGHDIKNLLSVIRSYAQLLQINQTQSVELIQKSSNNILDATSLIHSIVDKTIQSIAPNNDLLVYEKVYTDGIINEIVNQAMKKYGVENCNVRLGELIPVVGDKTLLYQLFMNLINNAVKFSSKKEIACLEIYSEVSGNSIIYYIKDNGIGIKEEEKSRIFNIFQRLSNANEFEGTGVGMSIVKRIVGKLNADIGVESEVGVGTSFKIIFPVC